nr:unnamed protein product [Digitaria exilis]
MACCVGEDPWCSQGDAPALTKGRSLGIVAYYVHPSAWLAPIAFVMLLRAPYLELAGTCFLFNAKITAGDRIVETIQHTIALQPINVLKQDLFAVSVFENRRNESEKP